MPTTTIIIPTLNEAENIDPLLKRVFEVKRAGMLDFDVLFVDSASNDGTCERVMRWQDKEAVHLMRHDHNVGLAGAVVSGAKHSRSDYVMVMDADLSHPPEIIPELLNPLLEGSSDMVIGSRYVEGGKVPDWPLSRKISSKLATIPARLLCDVKDPLAGLFAVERRRLVELQGKVSGFKIGLAILAEYSSELRVVEVPIVFRDRDFGESKMTSAVVMLYLKQLNCLFYNRICGILRGRGRVKG